MTEQINKRRAAFILWAFAILAAIITFLAYLPSLKLGFVNWDDPDYVYNNPYIRNFNAEFWIRAFTAKEHPLWHPLTVISYAVNYAIWGLNPAGYHFDNILFHAITTLLMFVLTMRLFEAAGLKEVYSFKGVFAGLICALLFGLHPLHVESVSWISERKDVLSGLFFVWSILSYLRYAREKNRSYYAASLVLFILALMSKPMAVTLPAVLLIIDYYPLKRLGNNIGKIFAEKIPFFILSSAASIMAIIAQGRSRAMAGMEVYSLGERVSVAVRAAGFYLYKTVWPLNLAPYYPAPSRAEFFDALFLAALATLVLITVFCLLIKKKTAAFAACWAYFIVTLLPVSGIMQVGGQAAADRYMYIPSISLFVLAGGLIWLTLSFGRTFKIPVTAVSLAIIVVMSVLTIKQEAVWKDSISLWSHEINLYPNRVFLAYYNRGRTYQELNEDNAAIDDYSEAIRLKPGFKDSYLNRGVIYAKAGRLETAINDFKAVIALDPSDVDANANLATAYSMLGDKDRAAYYLERSRR